MIQGRSDLQMRCTDIVRETPLYISIFKNYASYKLFHSKSPLFGSVDVTTFAIYIASTVTGGLIEREKRKTYQLRTGDK
jgi:hypothetical protein